MSFRFEPSTGLARKGTLLTAHGHVKTPTIFPVHNLGADAGWNTPRYWKEFPRMNTGMFNTAHLHQDKRQILPKLFANGIHKTLDFPGVVFLDSGGFVYRKRGLTASQDEILDLQLKIGGDIISTLDFPFLLSDRPKDSDITLSVQNAQIVLSRLDEKTPLVFVSVHAYDPLVMENTVRFLSRAKDRDLDGIAIGSLMRSYCSYELVIDLVLAVKRTLPEVPLHVYGLGGPLTSSLLAYLGVDSVDSSAFVINSANKWYFMQNLKRVRTNELENLTELPCECQVCRNREPKELVSSRELLSYHNLWICWSNLEEIQTAIGEGDLDDCLETKFANSPWTKKAFGYAKRRLLMGPRMK